MSELKRRISSRLTGLPGKQHGAMTMFSAVLILILLTELVLYATQVGVRPPSFVLFCNHPRRIHFSLRRFLENSLRERFEFDGAPLRLRFRKRSGKERR